MAGTMGYPSMVACQWGIVCNDYPGFSIANRCRLSWHGECLVGLQWLSRLQYLRYWDPSSDSALLRSFFWLFLRCKQPKISWWWAFWVVCIHLCHWLGMSCSSRRLQWFFSSVGSRRPGKLESMMLESIDLRVWVSLVSESLPVYHTLIVITVIQSVLRKPLFRGFWGAGMLPNDFSCCWDIELVSVWSLLRSTNEGLIGEAQLNFLYLLLWWSFSSQSCSFGRAFRLSLAALRVCYRRRMLISRLRFSISKSRVRFSRM